MKKYQCPSCNGSGGFVDVVCEGRGPKEQCGFCKGEGELSRRRFYICLGYESWYRRRKKQRILATLRTTRKGQNYGYCGDVGNNPFGPADMP